jgi:hypothetical protein
MVRSDHGSDARVEVSDFHTVDGEVFPFLEHAIVSKWSIAAVQLSDTDVMMNSNRYFEIKELLRGGKKKQNKVKTERGRETESVERKHSQTVSTNQ